MTCRKLVLPLSRSRMQRLQESAVCRVYPAGWPKIHHPPRLPSALSFLAGLPSEAPRFLIRDSSHVTYRSATFLLVSFFPLLPSGVTTIYLTILPLLQWLRLTPNLTAYRCGRLAGTSWGSCSVGVSAAAVQESEGATSDSMPYSWRVARPTCCLERGSA